MGYRVVTGPVLEPLTVDEARAHLREPPPDQEARIVDTIRAARSIVERYCQRVLLTQTWELHVGSPLRAGTSARLGAGWGRPGVTTSHEDDFVRNLVSVRDGSPWSAASATRAPGQVITLPMAAPLQSVSSVTVDGALLTSDAYFVEPTTEPAQVLLIEPGEFVSVVYICGVEDPVDVPPALKQACYLLVGAYFGYRGDQLTPIPDDPASLPWDVKLLLDPFCLAALA